MHDSSLLECTQRRATIYFWPSKSNVSLFKWMTHYWATKCFVVNLLTLVPTILKWMTHWATKWCFVVSLMTLLPTILRVPWNNVTGQVKIYVPRMLTTLQFFLKNIASELLLGSIRAGLFTWYNAFLFFSLLLP